MYYTEPVIAQTVTLDFLVSHLAPQHHSRANDYWKSIKLRARRIFLVLLDLGVPSQVFSFLDEGWDDLQLPFSRERLADVPLMGVFGQRDEHLEKRFYELQWQYLTRDIKEGDCVEFGEEEIVPVEVVSGSSGPVGHHTARKKGSIQHVQQVVTAHSAGFVLVQGGSAGENPTAVEDTVTLPDRPPGMVYTRRRISLSRSKGKQPEGQGGTAGCASTMTREDFLREVVAIKALNLQNEHLARYFASYTHHGNGYMLFTPATTEHTLKSILTTGNLPNAVKYLDKGQQRRLMMNWIQCLADTICWLHSKGLAHGALRPSNIFIAKHNNLPCLANFQTKSNPTSGFGPERGQGPLPNFDKEAYDYAAPELARYYRPTPPSSAAVNMAQEGRRGTAPINACPSTSATVSRPVSPPWPFHYPSPCPNYHLPSPSSPTSSQTHHLQILQAADIFALSCIILDILSFMVFKQQNGTRAFAAYRAANPKNKTPGRGGALPDSSFHRNVDQVKRWMAELARAAGEKAAASKKKKGTFSGIGSKLHLNGFGLRWGHGHQRGESASSSSDEGSDHEHGEKKDALEGVVMMVKVLDGMLSPDPTQRTTALEVQGGTYLALREGSGIDEPHCVHGHGPSPLGRLTTKTPSPTTSSPKQTTPTSSMYDGRRRSNSAVSTTSVAGSVSAPYPVCGLGSRSMSISGEGEGEPRSMSRWSHSTDSRSSTSSSSSFSFHHGFFGNIRGHSHSRGNGRELQNGQPRQRRTSSRASGPKQLLATSSSMSSATLA